MEKYEARGYHMPIGKHSKRYLFCTYQRLHCNKGFLRIQRVSLFKSCQNMERDGKHNFSMMLFYNRLTWPKPMTTNFPVCVGFFRVLQFLPTIQKHAGRFIVYRYVHRALWCIGILHLCAQCYWEKCQLPRHPNQDKVVTADEWMN